MLKLKRVEIQGFKSFYERTEMKFSGNGIAAVVGPNGCGKSNLSDAISWVLGEQSAKTLRGARMEDVIFAGTRDRKPLSMASVTMTLVPDEAVLAVVDAALPAAETPVEPEGESDLGIETNGNGNGHGAKHTFRPAAVTTAERTGEITITRRLYRSGESEYLINGKTARLRDIQDLFLGTGLGPESYAIIEQGRIGQILSNRPQDRRNVIEEAAGITKFKTRKRLAEAKLDGAKQNLARVFDILEEVTRQVNSLKRQAAKTRRYGELKGEATEHLKQILAARFQMLEREAAKTTIELNLISGELSGLQGSIAGQETAQGEVIAALYAIEQQLTGTRKQLADLELEAERARAKLEYQQKQVAQIDQRLGSRELEAREVVRQQEEIAVELAQQAEELDRLGAQCGEARESLSVKAAERQQAQALLAEQERGLEATRQQVLRLLGEASALKNRTAQVETQLGSLDRETVRARGEEQQSEGDLGRIQETRGHITEKLTSRQTELTALAAERKTAEQALQEKRQTLNEARQGLDRLRTEHSRVKARRDSLEEVIQHRSYTTETVKKLFTAVERGKTPGLEPVGVLADFLEVDPQYEKATEEFLHEELEYVVVRNAADAERGIEMIRGELNGRATFLVESAEGSGEPAELPQPEAEAGTLTRLTDALRFTNGLTHLPLHMLPRIGNCYWAADRPVAQRFALQYPHCWFLSPDGVTYQGLAISGGRKSGAGPLALKRELRELSQLERARQEEMGAAQAEAAQLERDIARLSEQVEQVRTVLQAREKEVVAMDHESRKLGEEFQRAQARLLHARQELERIARDRVRLEESLQRDGGALAESEAKRASYEEALEAAREQLGGLQGDVAKAAEEHSTLRAALASLEERQRSVGATRGRMETRARELENRRGTLERDGARLAAERAHLLESNRELDSKGAELQGSIAAAGDAVAELARTEGELRVRMSAAEEGLKGLRGLAHGAQERRSGLQVALARYESDLAHLEETSQKELSAGLVELAKDAETVPDEAQMTELEAKYAEAQRKIEALGPVNPQALEEHEQAQERQDFLSAQRQDLLDSIRDTEKAIHEIDGESRKRFGEAFHAINANFREMFTTLFGGGVGEMRLTDEDNLSESGIDIVASPPGKRLQSVLLLSGGEKSLTAMALLMGIFQYTPSPFCILDEIDAPLDEPNIERLTKLLRQMSEQTQFIVITHAKRTMEAAQSLYGVTMQEPGVSRLVSVKFRSQVEIDKARTGTASGNREQRQLEAALVSG